MTKNRNPLSAGNTVEYFLPLAFVAVALLFGKNVVSAFTGDTLPAFIRFADGTRATVSINGTDISFGGFMFYGVPVQSLDVSTVIMLAATHAVVAIGCLIIAYLAYKIARSFDDRTETVRFTHRAARLVRNAFWVALATLCLGEVGMLLGSNMVMRDFGITQAGTGALGWEYLVMLLLVVGVMGILERYFAAGATAEDELEGVI